MRVLSRERGRGVGFASGRIWFCAATAALTILGIQSGAPSASAGTAPHLTTSTSGGDFGTVGVGNYVGGVPGSDGNAGVFDLTNDSGSTNTIDLATGAIFTGNNPGDWRIVAMRGGADGCPGSGTQVVLGAGASCGMEVSFRPSQTGFTQVTLTITGSVGTSSVQNFQGHALPTLTAVTTPFTDPANLNFGGATLGTFAGPDMFDIESAPGVASNTVDLSSGVTITGPAADDYSVTPTPGCGGDGVNTVVFPGYDSQSPPPSTATCAMQVFFLPGALGSRSATLTIQGSIGASVSINLAGSGGVGYYQVDSAGNVNPSGDAGYYGDAGGGPLNKPIVGMAATGDNGGYWLVATDGGIFSYGDANFFGSTGGIRLNQPIVGMAATPDAGGYWLVATDGGIFSYGDAPFYGSTGAIRLNKPIVGMSPTPDGRGYWLVASDGGIFSYGDAQFYGSTGSITLNKPIVGMSPTPDGRGYWLVASDGGIFAYGDAQFFGSTGSIHLAQPIVAMAAMPDGSGYWFSAADGGLFNYGRAPFYGSSVGVGLGTVVDMVTDGSPTFQAFEGIPAIRGAHIVGDPAARRIPHFEGH